MIIKKVKIIKNNCLEVVYTDNEGNDVSLKGANPAHNDLREAMKRLVPFFCDLTEQKEAFRYDWDNPDSDENEELLRKLSVFSITISGSDAFTCCVMSGRRTLTITNKVLNINTPPISLDDESESYEQLSDLVQAIDAVTEEAKLYITEHKYSVVQTTIDFENTDDPFGNDGEAGESKSLNDAS